jgi:translation initiation factor 5A
MSHTVPIEAHHVKKGGHIMLKGFPCKVVDVKTSKTGKHGHAKCNITGVDVLSAKKYNEVHPGHIILGEIQPQKNEYEVSDVDVGNSTMEIMGEDMKNFTMDLYPEEYEEDAKFLKVWQESSDDNRPVYMVTTVTAPIGITPESMKLKTVIASFKEDTTTVE